MVSYQSKKDTPLHWRRTKIIATLGPASNTEETIGRLIDEGANIFRLNMSHGTHEEHRLMAAKIRKVEKLKQKHIAILMDLCGPKIRVGLFENDSIKINTKKFGVKKVWQKVWGQALHLTIKLVCFNLQ